MNVESLFAYIDGYTDGSEDLSDGAFWQLHVEAVDTYNKEFNTSYDWYEIQYDYVCWHLRELMEQISPN